MLTLSLRDLRAHAGRYVLTFLAVTIGVGFVSGVITLTDTISRTYDDLFAGLNGGTDVAVRGTGQFELGAEFGGGVQRPRIAASLAEEVAEVDGVAAAEGSVQGYARPIGPDGEPYGNPTFGAPTIGMSWGEVDELNPFVLADGRAPEGPGEIVLDKHTADELGYEVGDTAEVQTAGGVNVATVVGIARFGTFLLAFALISVLVGTFVIYTSFSFIVAQRQRQVALLRAIGAGRGQVLTSVVIESLLVGVVASVVGYGAGVVLATVLTGAFVPGTSPVILPLSAAIALTVGTAVTMASALFPAARASRVPPVAAMRDVAIDTSHRSLGRLVVGVLLGLAGGGALGAGVAGMTVRGQSPLRLSGGGMLALFIAAIVLGPIAARPASLGLGRPLPVVRGIVGRLAQQNAARNPKRTASTATALMIGLGIVSLFLVINASIRASLDHMVDDRFSGDFVIDAGTGFTGGGLPGTIAEEVGSLPEVEAASGVRVGFAEIDGEAVMLGGFNGATAFDLFDVNVTSGHPGDLKEGEIGVFDEIARSRGWQVGDEIPVVFGDTGTQQFTVVALFDSKDLTGAYVVDTATFDANLPGVGDNQVWLRLGPGVSAAEARDALEPVVADFPSAEVLDLDEFKAMIKGQYDVILVLVNALMALTIVIAMIGIVNTLVLSVVERTREIALTRAVGASRGQVRSSIRWEALLIASFGLAAALGIGVSFGWVLVRALADDGFSVFALPTTQLAAFTAVTPGPAPAPSGFPAAWAGRRHILSAIVDR